MTPPRTIDAADLAWLVRCERRVWLDQHGAPVTTALPTADARARLALRAAHTRHILDALEGATRLVAHDWPDARTQTTRAMQRGDRLIIGAALEAPLDDYLLHGLPDILVRIEAPSAFGAWSYQPVAVALHSRATRWDRLLLNAWRWLVGTVQGVDPAGELWLGAAATRPAHISRQVVPLDTFVAQVKRAAMIGVGDAPPIWFDSDHCPFCPWRLACDAAARESGDVALLPGLSRRQGVALRRRGIRQMAQVPALDAAILASLPDSLPDAGTLLKLQAQALLAGRPVVVGGSAMPLPRAGMFLDIETDPLTRTPWAFGLASASGNTSIIVVGSALDDQAMHVAGTPLLLVRNVHEGWNLVLRAARAVGGVMAHWGEAERLLLQQSAGRRVQQELAPLLLDAQRELSIRVALPVPRMSDQRGGGLKAIARWLGWSWPAGADHWTLAWGAYQHWTAQRSRRAALEMLTPAVVYLRADVEALAAVWRWFEAFMAHPVTAGGALPDSRGD